MIDADDGDSPMSPYFKGEECKICGCHSLETDEHGHCPNCKTSRCDYCGEDYPAHLVKRVIDGSQICYPCRTSEDNLPGGWVLEGGYYRFVEELVLEPVTDDMCENFTMNFLTKTQK